MELYETNNYIDDLFPVGIYQVTPYQCIPHGRGYRDLHWHEELQYVLVLKGNVTFQVNGIDYHLKENDVLFINKSILHVSTSMSSDSCYISLNFPEKLLDFYPNSRIHYKYVSPYTDSYQLTAFQFNDSFISEQLLSIYSLFNQSNKEYDLFLSILQLWKSSIQYFKKLELTGNIKLHNQQERMQSMLNYIYHNYQNPITLSQISKAGKISIAQCHRDFKNIIKMSPYEYLIHYRLIKSIDYLLESSFNITEISEKVGFQNVNYYIKMFRRYYKTSPKQYQKEHIKK